VIEAILNMNYINYTFKLILVQVRCYLFYFVV